MHLAPKDTPFVPKPSRVAEAPLSATSVWRGIAFAFVLALVASSAALTQSHPQGGSSVALALHSSDFQNGGDIPRMFTCDGEDRSPALDWTGIPEGTKSFALIADDPDAPAGTWVHWVIFNIPASTRALKAGLEKNDRLPDGTRQGRNDFRKIGYNGPCPPPGNPHRYFFKLYALNSELTLSAGATKSELEHAMEGRIRAHTEWMGRYKR